MVTWLTSARNMLRSPSGAANESPDGPGAFQALRDDVDNYIGVGGAEYCANAAAMTAIPAGRKFVGKLAYRADQDIVYRYVGSGNAPGGGSAAWVAYEKPPTAFNATLTGTTGAVNSTAYWGIAAGLAWVAAEVVPASGFGITAGTDVSLVTPFTGFIAGLTNGRGTYFRGGLTSNVNTWDLAAFVPGPAGGVTNTFRIRGVAPTGAAGVADGQYQLSAVVASPYTSDRFQIEARSPSGLVA